ncbi:CDP-alcohol phosphatidyltransferase family protein [Moritella viscosa]|uniref:Phosphatidylglycerophosphate synthase n=1 Tax=Moritella viscosa TaxID=80854 RepID=A0A090IFB3_9GAMM|nr:CDP-alcohol phosphatidyltransferase family protein [Moritella viscosa]CED60831.1 CDP-alcohol phosphatidyltransferase [Moritella viscosa]SGY96197.1 Putative phosphatidylglycerophosphate synthase [Moritella viscosa]SGZ02211.1 Putative phosphatidylglycerophosphate synthase [Moritella viscosa]SGZ08615.1 Putative phosphatidylglycerophosphate synthase [Moritella viscosa]SGZ08732.1 Putative phosphatidylglycerophosphate synthase [Moritella viscosa]
MLDRYAIKIIRRPINTTAKLVHKTGIKADQVTLFGFILGLMSFPALALQEYNIALMFIILNRVLDAIDGAVARIQGITDSGGFLDITLDFLFYSLVPFGFVVADPNANAVAGAFLIFAFIGTGSSFLAFAIMASKQNIENPIYKHKSLYYMGGLTEGTETILCFILLCLFPASFTTIAYIFATLCWITTVSRIWAGYQTLK